VPREISLKIFINGRELVTILCTPSKINCLVLGYSLSEGIIGGLGDVTSMRICEDESLADIYLKKADFTLPKSRILTSGCGSGISLTSGETKKINSNIKVSPESLLFLISKLAEGATLYRKAGGIHTSALGEEGNLIVISEDIGRHNTLDKILGECLIRKIPTKDKILLTTGRLSSEMLRKAAGMDIPIIVSLTSPTDRAISLARDMGITLLGYASGKRFSVYTCFERLRKGQPDQII
jgi:FdhD protein